MRNLVTIQNVKGYLDENGVAYLNLEDVARGLGFIQLKNNVEYVRWERVNGYLEDMGFPQLVGKDFIPENVFYRLAMKGETESAIAFQNLIADEILPSIRKTGTYGLPTAIDSKFLFQIAQKVEEQERIISEQKEIIEEQQPKVDFVNRVLKSKDVILIREFAKIMYDEKACTFGEKKMYKWLRANGYLMRNNEPYQQYCQYFQVEEKTVSTPFGVKLVKVTKINPQGQLYIFNKLKADINIVPSRKKISV